MDTGVSGVSFNDRRLYILVVFVHLRVIIKCFIVPIVGQPTTDGTFSLAQ